MVKKFRFPARANFYGSRKAQAETQLNWIFILIVGAVILAFFTFIVIKQRSASEAKFSGKVSQQLNTILVGAKVSSGTVQEIPTPDLLIRFTCNDYYIGSSSQRLGNRVLFAPEYLEDNTLITWSLDWNVPFKIANFLYMTSPRVRYVVVGPDSADVYANAVIDALPDKLNKEGVVLSKDEYLDSVQDENDNHVRFVFVGFPANTLFDIPPGVEGKAVSGLVVDPSEKKVQFLEGALGSFAAVGLPKTYLEDEVLYGAIFSTKEDEFDCLMQRAYSRLNIVSKVYLEKFNEIAPLYESTNCEGLYEDNADLTRLIAATENPSDMDAADYAEIASAKESLGKTNFNAQLRSCPLIY